MKISRGIVHVLGRSAHIARCELMSIQFGLARILICVVCAIMATACAPSRPASASSVLARPPIDLTCQIVAPEYPQDARQVGQAGTVGVTFIVETDGTITNALVDKGSGNSAIDSAARAAVLKGHCSPYILEGSVRRVAQSVTVRFSMSPSMRTLSPDLERNVSAASAAVLAREIAERKGHLANWTVIATYKGSHTELDASSVQRNDNAVNLWVRTQWDEPFKISIAFIPVTEQLINYTIDCERNRGAILAGVFSNQEGPIDPPIHGTGYGEIRTGSPLAAVTKQYCIK
ncbi:energy transducer TonB [Caballeronia sp. 15711]|uniref:energy transducer TonB n=2 Tax=unclassified Caballeronia TaxID=2646786 RepID=UPI0039E403D1